MIVVNICTAPPQRVPMIFTVASSAIAPMATPHCDHGVSSIPLVCNRRSSASAIAAANDAVLPERMTQNSAQAQAKPQGRP